MAMLRSPISPSSLSSFSALTSPLHKLLTRLAPSRWRWKRLPKFASVYKASWQEFAGILVFSAIPFTAVKAFANSPLGESLQRWMEEKKKFAVENSSRFRVLAGKARKERKP